MYENMQFRLKEKITKKSRKIVLFLNIKDVYKKVSPVL